MENELTPQDKQRIEESILGKYIKVAVSPEGLFRYPTGRAGLEALNYAPEIIKALPEPLAASYCGVGNPFTLGPVHPGEAILDIGCGAGVDSIIAAKMVGPEGKVTGIDLVPEMLAKARKNAQITGVDNVIFMEASAEQMPFPDYSFDVVISNGVFNLVVDKVKALEEVYRILKPDGRFMLADQVLTGELPNETKSRVENWSRWEGGAIPGKVFLALLEQAGFEESELVSETGFNSSPVTKGVLFRAVKPAAAAVRERMKPTAVAERREDKMDYLLQRALELGAEKAKIIDTETVVVAEWVRWKCQYGCPLFEKDSFHPPFAPDVESTKKVLKEYTKAILLNGSNGRTLTEAAVKLEGEAYHRGYYKAFALTALVPSGGASCAPPGSNPGATWPSGVTEAQVELPKSEQSELRVRPMMEACGIDVFKTARHTGFDIDTRKETYGRWNYFALVLIE